MPVRRTPISGSVVSPPAHHIVGNKVQLDQSIVVAPQTAACWQRAERARYSACWKESAAAGGGLIHPEHLHRPGDGIVGNAVIGGEEVLESCSALRREQRT